MTKEEKRDFVRQMLEKYETDKDFAAERWIQEQQGGYATYAEIIEHKKKDEKNDNDHKK